VKTPDIYNLLSIPYYGFKYLVDALATQINTYKLEDTITLSGTPRGGTTWFMELLETLPEYKSVFEPLHPDWFPELKRLGFSPSPCLPRPYLHYKAEDKKLGDYLYRVFTGQVVSRKPRFSLTPRSIYTRIKAKKLIVKFIRANRILPWIVENFTVRGTYFLLRHPCATIASQLETGITGYLCRNDKPLLKEVVIKEASQIPLIKNNEWLMNKLHAIKTQEEVLAAVWSMDNYIPLSYLNERPEAWYTVVYERLITDFEDEIERIFSYINEEVPEEVYEKFRKPSRTTRDKSYLGTPKQILKWKKKLSERQVKNILKVVYWFDLDFYTEDPEPDYDALKNWKSAF